LTTRLFVYGTLSPGNEAWPVLEPWVVGTPHVDAVAGRLYDTGRGYPAATFDLHAGADDEVVHGMVVILDPGRPRAALTALDRYEGREYQRITVVTQTGLEAAAYAWISALTECRALAGGRWTDGPQAETRPPSGR
jgi:gamma-glutamylcyclotransferase (GGCT)/AIG2-like uncharacterized protein YtfP